MIALQYACLLILLPCLLDAVRRSGIEKMSRDDLFIWIGLTGLIFGILLCTRDLPEGVTLKYSGAAFMALTLGYSRALLSMTLLLLITQPWANAGVVLLVDALLPIWLMIFVVNLSRRYLPANPFIFLLGCSFIGLFTVYAVQQCVGLAVWSVSVDTPILSTLFSERTGLHLLLASGEATLEGMIITILVVYFPQAVLLFDDEFYLSRPM
ncbi:hypothetical protein [Granulosicoccus antarcticus]|uniref:Uncharacterized protein n=1 Tax=Granulosicoccus antarcticus IMCC3135 TaxID=1192854 RepID=A0A2Z2P843_9GAMM|nr:hypothetical protein [Granulosicoccus antarcticus]ASJ76014.1 hypothetical protein IMCC3135_29825 [Granulosicoccus antarcticus IMCC3135]